MRILRGDASGPFGDYRLIPFRTGPGAFSPGGTLSTVTLFLVLREMNIITIRITPFGRMRVAPLCLVALLCLHGCSALFGGSKGVDRDDIAASGFDLLEKGSYSHAMGVFNDLIDENPGYALAHYGLGRVFTATGYVDGAAEQFRRAVELDSTYGEAYLGLGRLYYDLGFHDKAEAEILKAKRHGAGETSQALYLLGLFAGERGSHWEAETHFRRSLEAESENADVRLALVDLLRNRSRYEDALTELERSEFPRGKKDEVRLRFADCRLHLGQDLEAERLYREIVSRDRHSPEPRWGLTLLALRRSDYEETTEQLEQYSLLLPPEEGEVFLDLVAALSSPDARFTFLDKCRELLETETPSITTRVEELIFNLEGTD